MSTQPGVAQTYDQIRKLQAQLPSAAELEELDKLLGFVRAAQQTLLASKAPLPAAVRHALTVFSLPSDFSVVHAAGVDSTLRTCSPRRGQYVGQVGLGG